VSDDLAPVLTPEQSLARLRAHADRSLDAARKAADALDAAEAVEVAEQTSRPRRAAASSPGPSAEQFRAEVEAQRAARSAAPPTLPKSARPIPTTTTTGGRALVASGADATPDTIDAEAERVWRTARAAKDGRFPLLHVENEYRPEHVLAERVEVEHVRAIVAAGGICGPLEPRYQVLAPYSAARPIFTGLPSFLATRGGIIWQRPPDLADIVTAPPDTTGGEGVGSLTAADDAAGTHTKGLQCIACTASETSVVDAIYSRLCFSNFADRFNPEHANAWIATALAVQARMAEEHLLATIDAGSTAVAAGATTLGSMRDMVEIIVRAATAIRNRARVPETYPVTVIAPAWLDDAMSVDAALSMPGDNALGTTEADVATILKGHAISCVWSLDADPFAAQTAAAALTGWPASATLRVFPSDGWLVLDGGTLDLGFVRDSTTNARNRFETFVEHFQSAAHVWGESLSITRNVCISGASAATAVNICT